MSFVKPVLDKSSPIAFAVMIETHWTTAVHHSPLTTYRFPMETAYLVGGRALAQEIRDTCPICKRAKARLIEVEMGKVSEERLYIAPAFTIVQVDLFVPYTAKCEHNHRSTVKIWGVVFKCSARGAIAVHVMAAYITDAFVMAYLRFAARYGHLMKLPDEGSQLVKACKEMEYSWIDVKKTLNHEFHVGFDFDAEPVGGHNQHGAVERSIRKIRKFDVIFSTPKYKLDVLSYKSCFAFIANDLNNMPLCVGSNFKDLSELDLLTPNRLLLGLNNRCSMSGPCMMDCKIRMLEAVEQVFQS